MRPWWSIIARRPIVTVGRITAFHLLRRHRRSSRRRMRWPRRIMNGTLSFSTGRSHSLRRLTTWRPWRPIVPAVLLLPWVTGWNVVLTPIPWVATIGRPIGARPHAIAVGSRWGLTSRRASIMRHMLRGPGRSRMPRWSRRPTLVAIHHMWRRSHRRMLGRIISRRATRRSCRRPLMRGRRSSWGARRRPRRALGRSRRWRCGRGRRRSHL